MKNARDVLKEMAFNPDARESTKEAFLRALQNALISSDKAEVIPARTHVKAEKQPEKQMEFDFESLVESHAKKIG